MQFFISKRGEMLCKTHRNTSLISSLPKDGFRAQRGCAAPVRAVGPEVTAGDRPVPHPSQNYLVAPPKLKAWSFS